jgi:hypothetical protein
LLHSLCLFCSDYEASFKFCLHEKQPGKLAGAEVRTMVKTRYWVEIGGQQYPCTIAKRIRGWPLRFDFYDGSGGVALHGGWKSADKTS